MGNIENSAAGIGDREKGSTRRDYRHRSPNQVPGVPFSEVNESTGRAAIMKKDERGTAARFRGANIGRKGGYHGQKVTQVGVQTSTKPQQGSTQQAQVVKRCPICTLSSCKHMSTRRRSAEDTAKPLCCDKCDGPHASINCPIFKKKRSSPRCTTQDSRFGQKWW